MMRALALRSLVLGALAFGAGAAHAESLTVFAAASLKNALDEAVSAWKGGPVVVAYGASSTLARQVENGAPAQVFISADLDWMDYLERKGLVRKDSRRNLTGNALALITMPERTQAVAIRPGFALAALLGNGRLAIADPQSVPAGKYAKAALEKLGVWASVAGRIAPAENVRAALALVARGEAPYGIVYASDANAEPRVRVAAIFEAGLHAPIVYPAALVAPARDPRAAGFLAYLATPAVGAIFRKHGFAQLH